MPVPCSKRTLECSFRVEKHYSSKSTFDLICNSSKCVCLAAVTVFCGTSHVNTSLFCFLFMVHVKLISATILDNFS